MAKSKKIVSIEKPKRTDWLFLPMCAVLFIVPLILRVTFTEADPETYRLYGAESNFDFFSHGKAQTLYTICVISLAFLAVEWRRFVRVFRDRRYLTYGALCGAFVLFTLISSAFSQYPRVSFFGFFDRSEGFFTQLCYVYVMLFAAAAYAENRDERYLTYPLAGLLAIEFVFCVSQFLGHDLVLTDFIARLSGAGSAENIASAFSETSVYGTMYHYNHLGSYIALCLPFFAILAVNGREKTLRRILYAACAVAVFVLMAISNARGAIVGVALAALFGLILCVRHIAVLAARHRLAAFASVASILLAVALAFFIMPEGAKTRIANMFGDVRSLFSTAQVDTSDWPILDVRDEQDKSLVIDFPQGSLVVRIEEDGALSLTDSQGVAVDSHVETLPQGNYVFLDDARFSQGCFQEIVDDTPVYFFQILDVGYLFPLFLDEQHGTCVREYFLGEKMEIDRPEVASFFVGREKIGSMRGYIWGRTIPLLKQHLLLGSGPDTFAYTFPNRDLLPKRYAYNDANMVVDKAHNQYLQVFVQNGGIAFLCYALLLLIYSVDCFRLYGWKAEYVYSDWLGIALFLAIMGYLGDTLFIDSAISVAPVFWVLLGCGIAVNHRNRSRDLKPEMR